MIALPLLDRIIDHAFEEDLAGGDVTTDACVDEEVGATGTAVARRRLVACGGPVFERVFRRLEPAVEVELVVEEGALLENDAVLWRVRGSARSILPAERTANLTQRASGVATLARADVIMLDDFAMADVRAAVARAASLGAARPLLEVSGGVTFERIAELGAVGVDVISVGALTHSAPAADIALDLALS